ncbi:MAG: hypothetical protein WA584_06155 [Pyrinomonadaceae bacterium]
MLRESEAADEIPVEPSAKNTLEFEAVAPGIVYPCYKSFDEFIDVERLRSLDGYIMQRIRRRLNAQNDYKFYTGPYKLNDSNPERPGTRMIYLAFSEKPDSYFDLDRTKLWHPTEAATEFALLTDFIRTLPFEATGRAIIIYDTEPREVPAHRDHVETNVLHEFIWFRTNLKKSFYLLNHSTGEKKYIESYSAWFDTVNQFHGSDPCEGLCFSVRVDGVFTKEFRSKIPKPAFNKASTPAFWAMKQSEL